MGRNRRARFYTNANGLDFSRVGGACGHVESWGVACAWRVRGSRAPCAPPPALPDGGRCSHRGPGLPGASPGLPALAPPRATFPRSKQIAIEETHITWRTNTRTPVRQASQRPRLRGVPGAASPLCPQRVTPVPPTEGHACLPDPPGAGGLLCPGPLGAAGRVPGRGPSSSRPSSVPWVGPVAPSVSPRETKVAEGPRCHAAWPSLSGGGAGSLRSGVALAHDGGPSTGQGPVSLVLS